MTGVLKIHLKIFFGVCVYKKVKQNHNLQPKNNIHSPYEIVFNKL